MSLGLDTEPERHCSSTSRSAQISATGITLNRVNVTAAYGFPSGARAGI
jgi:hypothetical protein